MKIKTKTTVEQVIFIGKRYIYQKNHEQLIIFDLLQIV